MTNFKLAHFSDVHAGYSSGRLTNAQGINLREADGYIALSSAITDAINHEVNAALFCGDTFHSPSPDIRAIIFVQNQLRRLWDAGIKVYMLAGNHDTNDVRADVAASRVLHDPWRDIYSHAEPYAHHELADGINLHMVSHHMYGEQADTMKQIKPIPGEINIFSTHGSCIDPLLKEKLHTEQSPREIVIPDFLLEDRDWNYSLLGHIHERGWVGSKDGKTDTLKKKVYYNGSILRRGFSDKEVKLGRGWTLWEIDSQGNFKPTPKQVAQRPQIDFAPISAEKMTASQITEKVIENLKKSQTDGTNFDTRNAPLLRQKLFDVNPAKYAALDWKAINQQSQHAMMWAIKSSTTKEEDNKVTTGELLSTDAVETTDVVKLYDDWVSKSKALADSDKDLKKPITDRARDFVRKGQEATLESE